MATYSASRALFDALVQLARERGMLRDEKPFCDSVLISIAQHWMGQLGIDDIGPDGMPDYRVVWIITTATVVGHLTIPDPIDITDDATDVAFGRMLRTSASQ